MTNKNPLCYGRTIKPARIRATKNGAYQLGKEAHWAGLTIEENPYEDPARAKLWECGWLDASWDMEKIHA